MTEKNLPEELRGRVLVAGAGVSGRGCARLLASLGVNATIADSNAVTRDAVAAETGLAAIDAAEAVDLAGAGEFDLVITSPGWRPDSPLLVAYQDAGVEVIGDVELAYRLDRAGAFGAPRTWLVVTGTNGKTTTTGMLAGIMAAQGDIDGTRALAVGNIGISVYDALADKRRVDVLVAELSSFQLHWSEQLTPDVGVLLNLADDHIDWHGSFDAYADAKAKVLNGAKAVVGIDDEHVRGYLSSLQADEVLGFTSADPQPGQVGVRDGRIVIEQAADPVSAAIDVASAEGIEPSGLAGILDATAAAAAAHLAGATPEAIARGLANYRVAGHRGAVVHQADGIDFVDNSKATNPHAADAALQGLDNVIWIAGGQLKGAAVDELIAAHASQLKAAVLIGIDRAILADALAAGAPDVPVTVIDSTDPVEAMDQAVAAALTHAQSGDTVLLAPAAASLDMYTGMGQRGDLFAAAAAAAAAQRSAEPN